jgi:hypothetical protein
MESDEEDLVCFQRSHSARIQLLCYLYATARHWAGMPIEEGSGFLQLES